jgi:hypothetical protein
MPTQHYKLLKDEMVRDGMILPDSPTIPEDQQIQRSVFSMVAKEFYLAMGSDLEGLLKAYAGLRAIMDQTLIEHGLDDEPLNNTNEGKLDFVLIVAAQKMAPAILSEVSQRPISYQRLWERLGHPRGEEAKTFDACLDMLCRQSRIFKTQGPSNSTVMFYR